MATKKSTSSVDPVFPDVLARLKARLEDSNFGRCLKSYPIVEDFINAAIAKNDMERSAEPATWQASTIHDDEYLAKKFFSKSTDPYQRVRVSLWHVNMQLTRVFSDQLADEPWRIATKRRASNNRLVLLRNQPPRVNFVNLLWAPYFTTKKNVVVLSSPLFWRKKNGLQFSRNALEKGQDQGSQRTKSGWVRNKSFLVAGEVMAGFRLMKELANKFQAEFSLAGELPQPALTENNLIVIGSGRANELLRELQVGYAFTVDNHTVQINGALRPNEKRSYADELRDRDDVAQTSKYGVLTRFKHDRQTVTLVGAQHGRAVQGIIEYLTDPTSSFELFNSRDFSGQVPELFQVLFRVPVEKEKGTAESRPRTPQIHVVGTRVGTAALPVRNKRQRGVAASFN
jgi:hypothetical protein